MLGIAMLGVVLSIVLSGLYFDFTYFEGDTISYLFQARLFAQGRLAAEAPPDPGFSPSTNLNILHGYWYSRYPFGNALLLSIGVLLGAPWLIPALATGAALVLLHRILLEVYDTNVALIGSGLALISPATLVLGAVWFSEAVNRLFIGLFLLAVILTERRPGRTYPALAGFALGYALNTRPLAAVAFGVAGAGYWFFCLPGKRLRVSGAMFAVAFGMMVVLYGAWNQHFTGSPWRSTFNAVQTYERLGFGPRGFGQGLAPEQLSVYTAEKGLRRMLSRTAPAVSFTSLGWGYYHPSMYRRLLTWSGIAWALLVPGMLFLAVPPLLVAIAVLHPSRNRADLLFLACTVLSLSVYVFYYWDGASWGFTPTHTRYYSECTMFGILPLAARGMPLAYGWLRRWTGRLAPRVATLALALLLMNTIYSYVRFVEPLRSRGQFVRVTERLVRERATRPAAIFIPDAATPIGDYPFRSLADADVVYFRLAVIPALGLDQGDWQPVYQRYFQGRAAYLLRKDRFERLK